MLKKQYKSSIKGQKKSSVKKQYRSSIKGQRKSSGKAVEKQWEIGRIKAGENKLKTKQASKQPEM